MLPTKSTIFVLKNSEKLVAFSITLQLFIKRTMRVSKPIKFYIFGMMNTKLHCSAILIRLSRNQATRTILHLQQCQNKNEIQTPITHNSTNSNFYFPRALKRIRFDYKAIVHSLYFRDLTKRQIRISNCARELYRSHFSYCREPNRTVQQALQRKRIGGKNVERHILSTKN